MKDIKTMGRKLLKELKEINDKIDYMIETCPTKEDEIDVMLDKMVEVQDKVQAMIESIGIDSNTAFDMVAYSVNLDKLYKIFGL